MAEKKTGEYQELLTTWFEAEKEHQKFWSQFLAESTGEEPTNTKTLSLEDIPEMNRIDKEVEEKKKKFFEFLTSM